MKKVLILGFLFFLVSFKHPFYLSVTELKYNSSQHTLQGSVKLFINDIEDALKKINGKTVDLINPVDTSKTIEILKTYLQKRLLINVNGVNYHYELLGFEKEQEAIWLYIEVKNCPQPKKLEVENSLLYDYIKEQTNIVHMEMNGETRSSKVTFPEKKLFFGFGN